MSTTTNAAMRTASGMEMDRKILRWSRFLRAASSAAAFSSAALRAAASAAAFSSAAFFSAAIRGGLGLSLQPCYRLRGFFRFSSSSNSACWGPYSAPQAAHFSSSLWFTSPQAHIQRSLYSCGTNCAAASLFLCHFGEIALILCAEVFVLHDVRDFRLFGEIFKQQ